MYFLAFMCVNMSRSCLEYHLVVCFMAHRSTPPVPRESHPPGIPSWPSCNLIQMEKWLHWMFQSFMKCSLVVFTQPWSPAVSSGHDWKVIKTRLSNHQHLIVYGGYIITQSLNGGWNPRVYIYIDMSILVRWIFVVHKLSCHRWLSTNLRLLRLEDSLRGNSKTVIWTLTVASKSGHFGWLVCFLGNVWAIGDPVMYFLCAGQIWYL